MLVSDFVDLALRAAGVLGDGQTPSSGTTSTAFKAANAMIGQWAVKRWLVYHLVDSVKTCTGAKTYSVGPSGDFNLSIRPNEIDSCYVSMFYGQANQIDRPLDIITAREDYNRIALKTLSSYPYIAYYDNGLPLGTLYVWPIPSSLYTLTLTSKMPLAAFTSMAQDINLPAEYQEALIYNLAARLRVLYQLDVDAGVVGLARAALNTIRTANAQVQLLQMPGGMGKGGNRFNIYSGQ